MMMGGYTNLFLTFLLVDFIGNDAERPTHMGSITPFPFFAKSPGVKIRKLGGHVKFTCRGHGDNIKMYWKFGGRRVYSSEQFHVTTTFPWSTLKIANITDGMEGGFCCCLDNYHRVWESCGTLKIERVPVITNAPSSKTSIVGRDLTFGCDVKAFPRPTIAWIHNGAISCREKTNKYCTITSESYSSHHGHLEISNVSLEDAGLYQCIATNSLGSAYSDFSELNVEEFSMDDISATTIETRQNHLVTTQNAPTIYSTKAMDIAYFVTNISSYSIYTQPEHHHHGDLPNPNTTILLVAFLGVTLLIMCVLFVVCARKGHIHMFHRRLKRPYLNRVSVRSNKYVGLQSLKYPMKKLDFVQELGEGVFGLVYKARAPGLLAVHETATVAVKMIRDCDQQNISKTEDFHREAELLATFHHQNIIRLLGICIDSDAGKNNSAAISCLLFEYMDGGDLCAYLRSHGPDKVFFGSSNKGQADGEITDRDKLMMATHIACGMEYLSERNFIHRDLATRNCLISVRNRNIKIADFGLSRRTYESDYYKAGDTESVPIRWMSPEAILYGKYSAQSDVWAYGVTLWEIYSYALQPYFSLTNEEVICCVCQGKVLSPPADVPAWMFNLMQLCWQHSPEQRPKFSTIHSVLEAISHNNGQLPEVENAMDDHSVYVSLRRESSYPPLRNSALSDRSDLPPSYEYPTEVSDTGYQGSCLDEESVISLPITDLRPDRTKHTLRSGASGELGYDLQWPGLANTVTGSTNRTLSPPGAGFWPCVLPSVPISATPISDNKSVSDKESII